jgi:hypothetical protein
MTVVLASRRGFAAAAVDSALVAVDAEAEVCERGRAAAGDTGEPPAVESEREPASECASLGGTVAVLGREPADA